MSRELARARPAGSRRSLAFPGALLVAALAWGCGAEGGAVWVDLSRTEVAGPELAGEVGLGARVVREEAEPWLVVTVERSAWKPEPGRPGEFSAELPLLAVGSPRAGGAPYRLRAGGRDYAYEPDAERFEREHERGSFATTATRGLRLLLALAPDEEPPERAELAAVLAFQRQEGGGSRVGGRRLSGAGWWVPNGHPRALGVRIPPDSRLVFGTAVEPLFGAREPRTAAHTFRLRLDGALILEQRLEGGLLGEAIQWHALDLPRGGVQRARLEFEVSGPLALTSILAPRIGPRACGSYAARPFRDAGARRPDLVVFLADTFRADNLAAYGGKDGLTPAIDRFARESRTFARAWSTGTHTLAAHSSMFSGVYPPQNGQVDFYNPLPSPVETLAERLSAHGYRCAAVTDGVIVSESHGLAQGFELFDERRESGTLERVRAVLDADDGRPLFLFVQTYAAHTPYAVSAETRARWQGELALDQGYEELMASEVMRAYEALPLGADMPVDPEVRRVAARLHDLYRAGVAEVDALFGRFHAELATRGLLGAGYLMFASDHGESFFEHGRVFHANRVFEEELRVPLILYGPLIAAGREERAVSLIDFAPTLAGLAGLEPLPHWRGRSLLAPPEARALYAFQSHRAQDLSTLAVIDGPHKLIGYETLEAVRAGKLHAAFDLGADPRERVDLGGKAAWPAELMRARAAELEELLTPLVRQEVLNASGPELEEMQKLGYGGARPAQGE